MRYELGPYMFTDRVVTQARFDPVVVADVRIDFEVEQLLSTGRITRIIEITRTGTTPANGHHLERGIDRDLIDLTIANDGTIEDLEAALVRALGLEQA